MWNLGGSWTCFRLLRLFWAFVPEIFVIFQGPTPKYVDLQFKEEALNIGLELNDGI